MQTFFFRNHSKQIAQTKFAALYYRWIKQSFSNVLEHIYLDRVFLKYAKSYSKIIALCYAKKNFWKVMYVSSLLTPWLEMRDLRHGGFLCLSSALIQHSKWPIYILHLHGNSFLAMWF